MKKIFVFAMLVTIILSACDSSPLVPTATNSLGPKDLTGVYILTGTGSDGSEYTGGVEITKSGDNDNSYNIVWMLASGQLTGTGTFDGITLTGRCYEKESNTHGDLNYTLQPDGSLSGGWTYDGNTYTSKETFTPK
jgi:hypothetical protein